MIKSKTRIFHEILIYLIRKIVSSPQVSQIMGLESILGTANLWPILLALTAAPALFQLCTLPCCPESPKYLLINKGQQIESQRGN